MGASSATLGCGARLAKRRTRSRAKSQGQGQGQGQGKATLAWLFPRQLQNPPFGARHPWIVIPAKAGIHGRCSLLSKIKRFRTVVRVTFVRAKVTKTIRDGRCAEAVKPSRRPVLLTQSGTAPKLATLRFAQTWVPLRPLWAPVLGLLNAAQGQGQRALAKAKAKATLAWLFPRWLQTPPFAVHHLSIVIPAKAGIHGRCSCSARSNASALSRGLLLFRQK